MAKNTTTNFRFLLWMFIFSAVFARKHRLKIENDERRTIDMSTFGYLPDSILQLDLQGFSTGLDEAKLPAGLFGFTLDKMVSSSMASLWYFEEEKGKCLLTAGKEFFKENDVTALVFKMDFKNNVMLVDRMSEQLYNLEIVPKTVDPFEPITVTNRTKRNVFSDSYLMRRKRDAPSGQAPPENEENPLKVTIPAPVVSKEPIKSNDVPLPNQATPDKQTSLPPPNPASPKKQSSLPVPNPGQQASLPLPKPSSSLEKPTSTGITTGGDQNVPSKATSPEATKPHFEGTLSIPMVMKNGAYFVQFTVRITEPSDQGQYKLTFHNCHNTEQAEQRTMVNYTAYMVERNDENYLSAGHIPLPTIYFILSVIFLGLACTWLYVIKKSTEDVYKMHYLMLALVYIKSLALLFHAINYHFLSTLGHHEETIAIIYYITYLMRGILLFVTIVLIGAGWAFVKHILSDRDKKIFLIVIPLQILANVAQIFIEETEEGQSQYVTWSQIFIIVDLLCCGAILFPVVWSIRHLQESSQTDGKAAISLVKLKLFRHFYILIVCYIYFTRIIVYLLRIAVPFQYEWMDDLFRELATMIFYIVTAYKFRPASNNPYLQVPTDSDDEEDVEMDEVRGYRWYYREPLILPKKPPPPSKNNRRVTQSAALENVKNLKVKVRGGDKNADSSSASGVSKRESSHEYD